MSRYETIQDIIKEHEAATPEMLDDHVSVDDFFCTLKAKVLDLVEGQKQSFLQHFEYTYSVSHLRFNETVSHSSSYIQR